MIPALGTIEEEAAACRAAWKAKPRARYGVHIHHEQVAEALTEPIEARIAYILSDKPPSEQALRLRLMRPVTASAFRAYNEAIAPAAYEEAIASAQIAYDQAIASAWLPYTEAIAPAWLAYDEAVASAWHAYTEAVAPAWRAYKEAIASARLAHKEAIASARLAYDEATAPALRAYKEAIAPAHAALCPTPDCPWDGGSIFGRKP